MSSPWQTERRQKAALAYGDDYNESEDGALSKVGRKPSAAVANSDSEDEGHKPGAYAITRTTAQSVPEWDPTEQIGDYDCTGRGADRSLTDRSESIFEDERLSSIDGSIRQHSSFAASMVDSNQEETHAASNFAPGEHPLRAAHDQSNYHRKEAKKHLCSGPRWIMAVISTGFIIAATLLAVVVKTKKQPNRVEGEGAANPSLPGACHDHGSLVKPSDPFQQCTCLNRIANINNITQEQYRSLKDFDVFRGHIPDSMEMGSCDPRNIALVWTATDISSLDEQGIAVSYSRIISRYVLALLYAEWHGEQWTSNEKWLSSEHECLWHGVGCNDSHKITSLSLNGNNLRGSLVSTIGLLDQLKILDLRHNSISGSIPSELWSVSPLEELHLDDNVLKGEVLSNEIEGVPNLRVLSLSKNMFSGTVPGIIFSMTNLVQLELAANFGGLLPVDGWESLSKLEVLDLSSNSRLIGEIPSGIGSLTNLRSIAIEECAISGSIPAEIGQLTGLERFSVHRSIVSGTIPTELGNCSNLLRLILSASQIEGTLPTELATLRNLEHLCLQGSPKLRGSIPLEFESLDKLSELRIWDTQITGIPLSLCEGGATTVVVDSDQHCPCCRAPTISERRETGEGGGNFER